MHKRHPALLFILVIIAIVMIPGLAFADEGYDINNYDVHFQIEENGELAVQERIVLDYLEYRHGFYYQQLYAGTAYYQYQGEAKELRYKHDIKHFDVAGYQYDTYRENYDGDRYYVAKIGDPDYTVIGEYEYIINYDTTIGFDDNEEYDMLYRNLLFCEVGETIDSVKFSIEMPKDFAAENVYFYLGSYSTGSSDGVVWEKNGNSINGYLDRPMQSGEILTVMIILDEGYFVGITDPMAPWEIAIITICILCVLLSFILWLVIGRDKKVYPTVEFSAPDGMTPAEVGYIIDGGVENKDVTSLLMYWADKGLLKIEEESKNDFRFTKLADLPDDAWQFEHTMFDNMFASGDSVLMSSLEQSFYTTLELTKEEVEDHFRINEENNVFTPTSRRIRTLMSVLTVLPIIAALLLFFIYSGSGWFMIIIAAIAIGFPVSRLVRLVERWHSLPAAKRGVKLWLWISLLIVIFAVYIFVSPVLMGAADYPLAIGITLLSALAAIIMTIFTAIMRKRTQQGNQWFGKLLGLKRFIKKAEKERIIRLVEENPSFFYNILPYAYVLGVTNKWAKNFDDIGIEPPSWYSGTYYGGVFNAYIFTSIMTRNMSSFQSAMTSTPPTSGSGFGGGGFGGGGGFSGGGFGGGGTGGSW